MNEFSILQEISRRPDQTQRQLSQRVGLSLGMTNILLMRLARKGYIKIRQLDWKRTEYLLTLKGAMEKTRKSYAYTLHTIHLFQLIMERVRSLTRQEYERGNRRVTVVAWPETAGAVSGAISELGLPDMRVNYVTAFRQLEDEPGIVFIATEEPPPKPAPGQRFVSLLDVEDLKFRYPE